MPTLLNTKNITHRTRQRKRKAEKKGFVDYCERKIAYNISIDRQSAAAKLRTSLNSFKRFLPTKEIALEDIDTALMERYEAYLKSHRIQQNTCSFYMRNLRSAYNNAVEEGLMIQQDPFKKVYTASAKTEKRALMYDSMKKLKEMDLSTKPEYAFARDVFFMSFYLRGIPPIDLAFLMKKDLRHGVVTYHRRKTGQKLTIRWEKCMEDLLERLWKLSGMDTADSPFLLPIIRVKGHEQALDKSITKRLYLNASRNINRKLHVIGEELSLPHILTLYVARHSWASIAKNRNISISVISEGLGHDNERTTQIYLATLDDGVLDDANRKVIKGL